MEKLGYGRIEELMRVPLLAGYCEIMMDDGMYIDLMADIPGLDSIDFDIQFDRKTLAEVDGILIPFISFQDLLINKEKTGRIKMILSSYLKSSGICLNHDPPTLRSGGQVLGGFN